MRCVITGAAGFIGSSIADRLLQDGHQVTGIDCFIDYYPRAVKERNIAGASANPNYRFVEMNLLDDNLEDIITGADWIFHQAAQAGVRASWGSEFSIYTDNNILGTQRLLEAARKPALRDTLKKMVYASSSSVYGDSETMPTHEGLRPQPISPYGVSKLAAENLMVLYSKEFSVPTVSLRYFTVYGPRQRPDMAFHRFCRAGLTGEKIVVYGDGEQSRDFTFVSDIVAANIDAAAGDVVGAVMNVGGGSRVTVNEVLNWLQEIIGKKLNVERTQRQAGDVRHTGADISLARKLIGYNPSVNIKQGLRAEAEWMESFLRQS